MLILLYVNNSFYFFKVGLRDYQDCKADVILKYSADEARNLKSYGEFPETVKINETVTFGEEGFDDDIEFDEVDSSEEEGDGLGQGIDDI
jgi:translation initiation factor 1A